MVTLINTAADMKWLREVHIPRLSPKYKSAVIHGNEDGPSRVEVYVKRNPLVTDIPVVYEPDQDDEEYRLRRVR